MQRVDGVGARTWRRTVARRHTDGHRRYGQQNDQCRANPPPQLREICQLKHLRHYSTTEYRTQLKQTSRSAHIGNCTPKELDQLGFLLVARCARNSWPAGHYLRIHRLRFPIQERTRRYHIFSNTISLHLMYNPRHLGREGLYAWLI